MQFFFILMFLFMIIAPFLYFLYIFKHFSIYFKILFAFLTLLSFIVMMIKLFLQPTSSSFIILTLVVQFYIITLLTTFVLSSLYHFIITRFHKTFHKRSLLFFIAIALLFTSISYFTHFHKTLKSYEVSIAKESPLTQLKVAVISDVHLGSGTYVSNLKKLVEELNEKEYDLICLTGDLFDESTPLQMAEDALKTFSQIQSTYGIYAVNGNHEHYAHMSDSDIYKKYNIYHLSDNYVCVNQLFNIVGREDVSAHTEQSLTQILSDMNTDLPTIVLDHNPKRYQEVMKYADIQFSGHTHAGQFFPITLATAPLFDNVYGELKNDNFSLIVTSGYGSWGFPVRFLTNCEYLDVKITFTKK